MDYKVIITPRARRSLFRYIHYTATKLKNTQAAYSIEADARETKTRLSKIADIITLCEHPILSKFGYRKIHFRKHDFFMIYQIDGHKAIVEEMFHDLQDYESIFMSSFLSKEQ
ncbi:MAG: type II toxin-antitoxin system RelE/ParE family toxin [Flexilinea sp.]|nr:type II toxin-antitoxin system RelE/ParE family toxin [Flexilinea sp.]